MPIMPIIPGMPIIPEMPVINFAKVSNFGKVCATKSDTSELSEGNGEVRKRWFR